MPEVRDLTSRRPKDTNPDTLLPVSRCLKVYRLFQSANLKDFFGLSLHRTGTESRKWRIPCAKSPTAQRPGRHFPPIRTENDPPLYGTAQQGLRVQKTARPCTEHQNRLARCKNRRVLARNSTTRSSCTEMGVSLYKAAKRNRLVQKWASPCTKHPQKIARCRKGLSPAQSSLKNHMVRKQTRPCTEQPNKPSACRKQCLRAQYTNR